ncbi:MAG: phosphopantetheine-binding protein [Anaerolineae bacterium]
MPAVRELLGKPAVDTVTRWQGDKVTAEAVMQPSTPAPKPVAVPVVPPVTPELGQAVSVPAPVVPTPSASTAPVAVATREPAPSAPITDDRSPATDSVASQVLGIVAEKTGYPSDMLDLDLDLEADLGIDTVKQAETFQAVREAFSIPQQEGMSLRDYPTLESVIGFVHKMRPDLADDTVTRWQGDKVTEPTVAAPPAASPVPQSPGHPVTLSSDAVSSTVLGIVADKTGYPKDMLDLDLDLEADLGIDTVKQAETFQAVREAFSIPQQEGMSLRDYPTLESVIGFVHKMRPDLADDTVTRWQGDKVTEPTVAAPPAASPVTQSPGHPVTLSSDGVAATVLTIVAGKTGYPEDMLELDLDLEADLGIDTVKQAETFQAIREAYNIPFQEALSLRDYPTLQSVIGFVYTMRPDLADDTVTRWQGDKVTEATVAAPPAASPVPQSPGHPVTLSSDGVAATVLGIVAAKTGYPEDMLELDLDLEADLGIDTVKQAETFQAIREAYNIPFQEALSLRDYPTLQSVIGFVYTMRPDLADDTVTRWQGDKVTEATVAAPPAASPVPQSPGHPVTLSSDGVAATVLGIVAGKTGYPEDMLELDLDLEADLGIDTVKQAETFQAIREAYNIPFQEDLGPARLSDPAERDRLRLHHAAGLGG